MVLAKPQWKEFTFPFWLWPNVLSLDAPLVAVSWQYALARTVGTRIPVGVSVALGLAVWSVYVLDRILDGPEECSARHIFAALHRRSLVAVVAALDGAAAIIVLPLLPASLLVRGFAVAFFCGAYLAASQKLRPARVWKAVAMSLLFGAGVVLAFPTTLAAAPFLATSVVVFANTQLMECWKNGRAANVPGKLCLLALSVAGLIAPDRYLVALGLGCALMLALDIAAKRLESDLRGSLADAVLVFAALVSSS